MSFGLTTNQLILGSGIVTATGNNLYLNGLPIGGISSVNGLIGSLSVTGTGNVFVTLQGNTLVISGSSSAGGSSVTVSGSSTIPTVNMTGLGGARVLYSGGSVYFYSAPQVIQFFASDLITPITAGASKCTIFTPYGLNLTEVRASTISPPTGSSIIINLRTGEANISILSTKITIDTGKFGSFTSSVQPVIGSGNLPDNTKIVVDFDQVGSSNAGLGILISMIGYRTT